MGSLAATKRVVAKGVRQAEKLVLGCREVAADADGDAELVVVLERQVDRAVAALGDTYQGAIAPVGYGAVMRVDVADHVTRQVGLRGKAGDPVDILRVMPDAAVALRHHHDERAYLPLRNELVGQESDVGAVGPIAGLAGCTVQQVQRRIAPSGVGRVSIARREIDEIGLTPLVQGGARDPAMQDGTGAHHNVHDALAPRAGLHQAERMSWLLRHQRVGAEQHGLHQKGLGWAQPEQYEQDQ
jgi:hypothetical protein